MLKKFLKTAKEDRPVYITDVREEFQTNGKFPFYLQVIGYDKSIREFSLNIPACTDSEEREFVSSYIYAMIYNIISSIGALKIFVFIDTKDKFSFELANSLNETFQTEHAKLERYGYGKCLNVNERIINSLVGKDIKFKFNINDIGNFKPVCSVDFETRNKDIRGTGQSLKSAEDERTAGEENIFKKLSKLGNSGIFLGIDVGGTDIKLAASVDGRLVLYKEYDWFPSEFKYASELIDPIIMLVRLMRAGVNMYIRGKNDEIVKTVYGKEAGNQDIISALNKMENIVGDEPKEFEAIGLSFPDVVINNLIIGGETYKTKGMRENQNIDYENEFAKITVLRESLAEYVSNENGIMITNDGPMAAFTAAMEISAVEGDVSNGFFAHTLGTELGTGWVKGSGEIPAIPLEVYNFIIDLGSFGQKKYNSKDVRSINNFNTGLPGTLQKYTSQSGVFRLAMKYLSKDMEIYREAFELGLFKKEGEDIIIPTSPNDMRKPCLEFFMEKASIDRACKDIFREIGEYLAVTWQETEYIIAPEAKERSLFGRLVKSDICFKLMSQGAKERISDINMYAANDELANTVLMKQLESNPDYTVAQFAQAVGAIYFGCIGLI